MLNSVMKSLSQQHWNMHWLTRVHLHHRIVQRFMNGWSVFSEEEIRCWIWNRSHRWCRYSSVRELMTRVCGVRWGWSDVMCDVMWCDVMWCDVMWCDVMWCDVMWCDVMWCVELSWVELSWVELIWVDMRWYEPLLLLANLSIQFHPGQFTIDTYPHNSYNVSWTSREPAHNFMCQADDFFQILKLVESTEAHRVNLFGLSGVDVVWCVQLRWDEMRWVVLMLCFRRW